MGIDLSGFRFARTTNTDKQAAETAKRNLGAMHGRMLFQHSEPVVKAITEGLKAQVLVKAVSSAPASIQSATAAAVRAMEESVAKTVAALKAPSTPTAVTKTAPAPSALAAPAQRNNGNPPSVAHMTESEHRRAAEARETARKAAAQAEHDRVLVAKGGTRIKALWQLDPSLSDAAVMALGHIVQRYEANERKLVPVNGPDFSRTLDLPLVAAQAGYAELVNKGYVTSAKNHFGLTHVTPKLSATGV